MDGGGIYVDAQEIRTLTRSSLRRAYTMVLQDTWLFHGTIFDNIAYGKPGATMEEVVAAAKAAHIHSYISRLPQGYEILTSSDAHYLEDISAAPRALGEGSCLQRLIRGL